jgi:hypothetical protein
MNPALKRRIAVGGAVALAATGGGVAVAARGHDAQPLARAASPSFAAAYGSHHRRGGFVSAVVTYLGLSPDQIRTQLQSGKTLAQIADATPGKSAAGLIQALVDAAKQKLAAAVAAGRLTQAQADQLAASLQQRITSFVNSTRPAGPRPIGRGHGGELLQTAATYLGVSVQTLLADLRAGKTLAQVADATAGKSAAGLIAALVAHEKQELADAVSAGRLTQTQADRIAANLQQRVTALVNGTFTRHGPRGGYRHAGRIDT